MLLRELILPVLSTTALAALVVPLNGWTVGLLPLNVAAFLLYAVDKIQAKAASTRVPEWVLHLVALCGGAPGASIGRIVFRHKTQKPLFSLTALLGTGVLAAGALAR